MRAFSLRRAGSAETILSLTLCLALPLAGGAADPTADPGGSGAPGPAQAQGAPPAPPVRPVGPVSVSATRAERDVLEVPGNVTVIDREAIERSGASTLPELLRRQAGLFVTSTTTNPAGTQVEARGFNNGGSLGSSLLVQVDGRRVNEADTGNTDWATLPLDAVESIEIVRGPASALYGDNAVGGVIHIRTRPGEGPPRAALAGRVGQYASGQGSFRGAASAGALTGSLFAEGLTTDGYRHGSDFARENATGSLEAKLGDRVVLGASGGYHHDERDFPGALDAGQIASLGRRARQPGTEANGSDVQSSFVTGWIEAILAEDVDLRVRPYNRWRDDDFLITTLFDCPLGGGEVASDFGTDTSQSSLGAEAQLQVDRPLFGLRNRLIAGFDLLREEADRSSVSSDSCFGTFTTFSDLERRVYAGFLQEELSLSDRWLFSAGLRFDRAELELAAFDPFLGSQQVDPSFSVWSPKAALTWLALPTLSFYGSFARGFRLPNFDEDVPQLRFPIEDSILPDLEKQTSNAFELGSKWRSARVNASLALYTMDVSNEIIFDPATFLNVNFDRVRHRGVELGIDASLLELLGVEVPFVQRIESYGTYTLEDVTIRKAADPALEGERIPLTPLHRGSLGLFFQLPARVELAAQANLVGERRVSNDFLGAVDPLDFYATLDLLLAWRPKLGEHVAGALSVALRNATGEEYDDFAAKSAFSERVVFSPAARRTWEVGFQLTVRR
jgi:iron complex outermembrane receptor protein